MAVCRELEPGRFERCFLASFWPLAQVLPRQAAPKKRAMKLLIALEQRERGFYCGSTLILYKHMKSASINIRSAVIDFEGHTLVYQAGGGITLLSKVKDEFEEMTYKHDSFIRTLTL